MTAAGLVAVGNTPLVRLRSFEPAGGAEVWAKWEGANPTGSMKDRMALGMVVHGERSGLLRPGMRVVEYTGGSTGSSVAMVCAARGYRAHLVTADCFAVEKIKTMRAFGAHVDVLASDGGRVTPELFERFKTRIGELAAEPDTWWAEQFVNPGNAAGYRELAREIVTAMPDGVDGFVMGVGTGGAFSGVAEVLKDHSPSTRCVAVEPATSRNLSGGALGAHHLEGIGVGFRPPGARLDLVDDITAVSDADAFGAARALALREGMLAGQTSGANLVAAHRLAGKLGPGRRVVTVLIDTGLKYLTGELFGDQGHGPAW
ncbi:MAG TPA: cysteine synthase family protein [Nakamurella sp.]|nr:cysteine synthase family protein [Nakamurella sp.]